MSETALPALAEALADHRAGRLAEAEAAYRGLIAAQPRSAGANHHLGVLLVQTGRSQEGIALLETALEIDGAQPLYYFSLAKAWLAAGDPARAGEALRRAGQRGVADPRFAPLKAEIRDKAVTYYKEALAARPGDAALLDNLGSALLLQGKTDEAIAQYRAAIAVAPDLAEAHFHLGAVLSQNGKVAEGFAHYTCHAALTAQPDADAPAFKRRHDQMQRDYLASGVAVDGERLAGRAINPARPGLLEEWRASHPQMVVIDNFLTPEALEQLRGFCAGARAWKKIYPAGYLGAAPENGFAAPLLAQIVEEIQSTFAPILAGEPFRYLGAFKYDSEMAAGTNTHADNSNINVNFYIAPDDANLDPESGGLQIWDRAAPDLATMRRLNGSEEAVADFLSRAGAKRFTVPHRANRAVIFKSTQFHKTDSFRFKTDYQSQRINISLLFGQFGPED